MELMINGFFFGIGVVIGMYITTQISYWIEKIIEK